MCKPPGPGSRRGVRAESAAARQTNPPPSARPAERHWKAHPRRDRTHSGSAGKLAVGVASGARFERAATGTQPAGRVARAGDTTAGLARLCEPLLGDVDRAVTRATAGASPRAGASLSTGAACGAAALVSAGSARATGSRAAATATGAGRKSGGEGGGEGAGTADSTRAVPTESETAVTGTDSSNCDGARPRITNKATQAAPKEVTSVATPSRSRARRATCSAVMTGTSSSSSSVPLGGTRASPSCSPTDRCSKKLSNSSDVAFCDDGSLSEGPLGSSELNRHPKPQSPLSCAGRQPGARPHPELRPGIGQASRNAQDPVLSYLRKPQFQADCAASMDSTATTGGANSRHAPSAFPNRKLAGKK